MENHAHRPNRHVFDYCETDPAWWQGEINRSQTNNHDMVNPKMGYFEVVKVPFCQRQCKNNEQKKTI